MNAVEEELESIRAYEEAKAANDEAIPFAQAIDEIEDESDNYNGPARRH